MHRAVFLFLILVFVGGCGLPASPEKELNFANLPFEWLVEADYLIMMPEGNFAIASPVSGVVFYEEKETPAGTGFHIWWKSGFELYVKDPAASRMLVKLGQPVAAGEIVGTFRAGSATRIILDPNAWETGETVVAVYP